MEPVTTTAMIGITVGYLAKKLKETKSVNDFFNDFTDATVSWIRPLFLKEENQYEKVIEDLMKKPDSPIKQQQVETAIASHLEDHPADERHLKAMYEQIMEKKGSDLHVKDIAGKTGVEFKAKMKDSTGSFKGVKSEEGNIKIDIKLS